MASDLRVARGVGAGLGGIVKASRQRSPHEDVGRPDPTRSSSDPSGFTCSLKPRRGGAVLAADVAAAAGWRQRRIRVEDEI